MPLLFFCLSTLAALCLLIAIAWPWLGPDARAQRLNRLAPSIKPARAPKSGFAGSPLLQTLTRWAQDRWMPDAKLKAKLVQAGRRGEDQAERLVRYRVLLAVAGFVLAAFIVFVGAGRGLPLAGKLLSLVAGGLGGFALPLLLLENEGQKRRAALTQSFPDGLDLLLICIDSGLALDQAFRRVATELSSDHPALVDELEVTVSELAYLPDRRQCFENLGLRTGVVAIKTVAQALAQAERYGTPIAATLRAVAQDVRAERVTAAEKAAGSLPAKLTVPMIVFFLPALLIVILGPAILSIAGGQ